MSTVQSIRSTTTTTDTDTAAFTKVFPTDTATEQGSAQFVKKLVAVAVSNIAFLRGLFPRTAFREKSVGGLPIKLLKQTGSPWEEAAALAAQLVGVFDAIERKFLRELLLVVHTDPRDPDTAEEVYTFRFTYSAAGTAMEVGGKEVAITADTIRRDTEGLLRKLLVLTESLPALPGSALVSMKLTYHEGVTPEEYQPAGFEAAALVEPRVAGGRQVEVGAVATRHQALVLSALAATRMEEREGVTEGRVEEPQARYEEPQAEELVACVCGNSTMDPVMVRCCHCGGLEHAACYRLLVLPELHCCLGCSKEEGRTCTDPRLERMFKKPDVVASTLLFRRLLVALVTEELATVSAVAARLGAEEEEVKSHLARLAEGGMVVIADHGDESFQVLGRSHDATRAALRKYLGIREQGNSANTADSTANTTMKVETKEEAALVIEVPAAAPSAAGDQGAKRSRRRAEVEGAGVGVGEERLEGGNCRKKRKMSCVAGLKV